MDANFTLPLNWRFTVEYVLPKSYRGFILRGAKVVSAKGDWGNIIIQTFEQPLFTIRFKVIEFFHSVKIPFTHSNASLLSFLALKNNIHYRMDGIGVLKLGTGQFSVLRCKENHFTASYEKNKVYHSLEVNWSEEIVQEHVPYFRLLEPVVQPGKNNKSFLLGRSAYKADHTLLGLADDILKSPYNAQLNEVSFQHKSRDYFFLMMVAIGKIPAKGLNLPQEDWEKIAAIAELLKNDPANKFPIAGLATSVQMNPTKLKEGFKEKYNCGMFEYQMNWRMKEAKRLLEETDIAPKDISARVGYRTIGSFITKFREYYGYPPGKVVRKFK